MMERIERTLRQAKSKLERGMLREHFRIVEAELRAAPGPSGALAAERLKNLDRLRAYREAGRFPSNRTKAGWTPFLRDGAGASCAVALLAEASGGRAAVDAMRAADNHAWIADLKGGSLLDWIERSGLTQREAARIQAPYGPDLVMLPPAIYFETAWLALQAVAWLGAAAILVLTVRSFSAARRFRVAAGLAIAGREPAGRQEVVSTSTGTGR